MWVNMSRISSCAKEPTNKRIFSVVPFIWSSKLIYGNKSQNCGLRQVIKGRLTGIFWSDIVFCILIWVVVVRQQCAESGPYAPERQFLNNQDNFVSQLLNHR